jgi:3-hydroxybutyryl-CoA dehydrogenase
MSILRIAYNVSQAASENVNLKTSLFQSLAAAMRPDAILATNTSSISITKMAAAAIPQGETAASAKGKASAARVVG